MKKIFFGFLLFGCGLAFSQTTPESSNGLNRFRANYDVGFYDLNVKVNPTTESIQGTVTIRFKALENLFRIQLDLVPNLEIVEVTQDAQTLKFLRKESIVWVDFPEPLRKGKITTIQVTYRGKPQGIADAGQVGGVDWRENLSGKSWITVSTQHAGGRLWWPCKDDFSDKADSMRIHVVVPKELTGVANGHLESVYKNRPDGYWSYNWRVSYPIQPASVTLHVSNFQRIQDTYEALDGAQLSLEYYVMPDRVAKAQTHFQQVKTMLNTYEKIFGKYPFWRDGYRLVETPFQGMAPQGVIPYANFYRNLPTYDFDYTIVHESAHHYFGNSVSYRDQADAWISEAFATYAEILYLERTKDYLTALERLKEYRKLIKNTEPLVEPSGVEELPKTQDQAYKGAWILHTLRKVVNNDSLWYRTLRAIPKRFAYQVITTEELVRFFNQELAIDCTPFFNQYLFHADPPVFEFTSVDNPKRFKLTYRWRTKVPGFVMPVRVTFGDRYETLYPTNEWQTVYLKKEDGQQFRLDTDRFYIFGSHLPLE